MPSNIRHILRLTYRTIVQRIQIDNIEALTLLDRNVFGIDGVTIHETARHAQRRQLYPQIFALILLCHKYSNYARRKIL